MDHYHVMVDVLRRHEQAQQPNPRWEHLATLAAECTPWYRRIARQLRLPGAGRSREATATLASAQWPA